MAHHQRSGDSGSSSDAAARARRLFDAHSPLPKVLVLDLDYTVWPFWCEMYSESDEPWLYDEVEAILDAARARGIQLAAASRTPTPHVARAFLRKLGLDTRFDTLQLIPAANGWDSHSAQKHEAHLPAIQRALGGVAWHDMLFFDDEAGNVAKVGHLGVPSIRVSTSTGLCCDALEQGLAKFAAAARVGGSGS